MKTIFQGMVTLCVVLMTLTLVTAYLPEFGVAGVIGQRGLHMLLGLCTAIVFLTVHAAVVMNYFIATGKAMDEALDGHPEHPRIKAETRKLKMKSSPAATMACIWIIVAAVLGGRAWQVGGSWWHLGFAWFAVVYNLHAFRVEYRAIVRNMELIEEVREMAIERLRARRAEAARAAAEALPEANEAPAGATAEARS